MLAWEVQAGSKDRKSTGNQMNIIVMERRVSVAAL